MIKRFITGFGFFFSVFIIVGIGALYIITDTLFMYFKVYNDVREYKTIVIDSYQVELMDSYQDLIVIHLDDKKLKLSVDTPRPSKGDSITVLYRIDKEKYVVKENNTLILLLGVFACLFMIIGPILLLTKYFNRFENFMSRFDFSD